MSDRVLHAIVNATCLHDPPSNTCNDAGFVHPDCAAAAVASMDPCWCVFDARTGGRTDNPHCPAHRVSRP